MRRVVITGLSAVTPIGVGLENFWSACKEGCSGVRDISSLFPIPDSASCIAGVVENFYVDTLGINREYTKYDRVALFAFYAIEEALEKAGILSSHLADKEARIGVYLSSAVSQITSMERFYNYHNHFPGYNPFLFNNLTFLIMEKFKIRGRCLSIPTGCAGGVDALSHSVKAIRSGMLDMVITGAAEAPITPLVVAAFNKIGATSTKRNKTPKSASRPFDKDRDGFVLSEGCGILILESLEHALKRNAHIYAEVAGVGSVNNAFHMTDIPQDGEAIAESCNLALKDAGLFPQDIDFINAHGSSTPQNDIAETQAFHRVFGERASCIPVSSIKSQTGHALAAANAIELVSAVMSIQEQVVPPTINLDSQDPECKLNVIKKGEKVDRIEKILKTSSGFSGIHSSAIIQKFERSL